MDDNIRKPIMIGIVVVCIVAAIGITIYNKDTGDGSTAKDEVLILCSNCDKSFKLSENEFGKKMRTNN